MVGSLVRLARVASIVMPLVTAGSTAGAQSLDRLHFGLAAGAEAEPGRNPGLALLGSVEVSHVGSPLGVRGELLFTQTTSDQLYPAYLGGVYSPYSYPYLPTASYRDRRFGALLTGTYEFRRDGTVRPFLLGGAGAYFTRRTMRVAEYYYPYPPCPPEMLCITDPVVAPGYRLSNDDASVGLHAGLGTTFDVGRVQIVAQARYHLLDGDYRAGRLIPLTIGLRF